MSCQSGFGCCRFVTACESSHLYLWHAKRRQLLAKVDLGVPLRSAAYSPDAQHLAVSWRR